VSANSSGSWFARADRTLKSQPEPLEVAVEVSGARAAAAPPDPAKPNPFNPNNASDAPAKNGAEKRELFSETTQTTLVFEDGAVVRLCAAVEVGQLLFLRHCGSQREIVTRVLRQRSFGAANVYVELEFSDAAPDFWNEDLAAGVAEAASGSVANGPETREQTEVEADTAELMTEDAPPELLEAKPNAQEVEQLRAEIAGLREHMNAILVNSVPEPAGAVPSAMELPMADVSSVLTKMLGEAAEAPAEGVAASKDPRLVVMPTMSAALRSGEAGSAQSPVGASEEEFAEEFPRTEEVAEEAMVMAPAGKGINVRRKLIAAVLTLSAMSGAAYQQGMLARWFSGREAATNATRPLRNGGVLKPAAAKSAAANVAKDTSSAAAAGTTGSGPKSETGSVSDMARGDQSGPWNERSEVDSSSPGGDAVLSSEKNQHPTVMQISDAGAVPDKEAGADGYEPPRVVKAPRVEAPPEAVLNFVTGDVKCDALVDAKGKVESAGVISGPMALRTAALGALRKYQYKAALRNGQAVAGHVEVTVKFWYEP
jgi:hypothetical protein